MSKEKKIASRAWKSNQEISVQLTNRHRMLYNLVRYLDVSVYAE